MNIVQMISKLVKKDVSPKVYSLVLYNKRLNLRRVVLTIGYSLDDVFNEQKEVWAKELNDEKGQMTYTFTDMIILEMHLSIDLYEFLNSSVENKIIVDDKEAQVKNELLRKIILEKNDGLYKKNKMKFNDNECKLIEEELKKNV